MESFGGWINERHRLSVRVASSAGSKRTRLVPHADHLVVRIQVGGRHVGAGERRVGDRFEIEGRFGKEGLTYTEFVERADDRAIRTGFEAAKKAFGADVAQSYVNHLAGPDAFGFVIPEGHDAEDLGREG